MEIIIDIIAFIAFLGVVLPIFIRWGTKQIYYNSDFLTLLGSFILVVVIYYWKNH